jgi:methyl-accepting chemotaxis protein
LAGVMRGISQKWDYSEDSKEVTRDITHLIERVQETVRGEAIGAMGSTVAEVGLGTRLAVDTTRSLEDILQAAWQAAGMATQIAKDTV